MLNCSFTRFILEHNIHSQHQLQIWVLKWTLISPLRLMLNNCKINKTSFFHLRNIARLRPMLTIADAEKLVHAFVSSRLDYYNALLIRIPGKNLQKLQYIQNSAARILMRVRKYDYITPLNHYTTLASCFIQNCLHGLSPYPAVHSWRCPILS